MFGFLRLLFLSVLIYAVFQVLKKIFRLADSNRPASPGRDPSKEVKSTFNSEDVTDAKFKDIK